MRVSFSHRSILYTAIIAGLFSALVGVVLIAGFLTRSTRLALDDPGYQTLKARLEKNPADVELQGQLRSLDVRLRRRYFQRQAFLRRGGWLLAGGVAATLLCAHWAATVRRRLPGPKAVATHQDVESRSRQLGPWATAGVAVVLATIVVCSRVVSSGVAPGNLQELAELRPPAAAGPGESGHRREIPEEPDPDPDKQKLSAAVEQPRADSEQFALSWPRFRGIQGAGASTFRDVPVSWNGSSGEGILWKTPIPLPGVSSPIVWQDRIFVTGATQDRREVCCVAAADGNILWNREVGRDVPDTANLKVSHDTGFAAPTPATDGDRVYAMFARGDLAAFDFDGNELWCVHPGTPVNTYGHAASLTTYQDLVIVQLDQGVSHDDKSRLTAVQGATGETVWEVDRAVPASWCTPIVVQHAGEAQIITSSDPWVIAYAAEDGREIWRAGCLSGEVGSSPVYDNGIVYVASDNAAVAAIEAGGQGDVTESHIRWMASYAMPDICSPLVTDRYLLLASSYGTLAGYERERGGEEPLWEVELDGICMASPSLVGDHVYLISDDGKGSVLRPHDTGCEKVAGNDLGERCFASPAFQPGRLYVRGEQHLFCIGHREQE